MISPALVLYCSRLGALMSKIVEAHRLSLPPRSLWKAMRYELMYCGQVGLSSLVVWLLSKPKLGSVWSMAVSGSVVWSLCAGLPVDSGVTTVKLPGATCLICADSQ